MKTILRVLIAAAGLLAQAAIAQYPTRAVKLIVPFPAGSPPDIVGRQTAQKLSEGLGQPFMVENRPGAAGTMGAEAVAKSSPDGYTLLLGTTGSIASAPHLFRNVGYDAMKSFVPISRLTNSVFLVFVHASVPAKSLPDLVELAKAKPGELAFGSGGNGSPLHIAGEMFKIAAGVNLLHVPYSGAGAFTDFASGRTQVMFEQLPSLFPYLREGNIRALAVAGHARLAQLPAVPTTAEAGLPGYEVSVWTGLLAPAGTPPQTASRLNSEVRKALDTQELREAFAKLGFQPAGTTAEEFRDVIRSDSVKWSQAIKASGAKLD
jgi:tripartite-type tricarboxylate transporter receptor subunit TctC